MGHLVAQGRRRDRKARVPVREMRQHCPPRPDCAARAHSVGDGGVTLPHRMLPSLCGIQKRRFVHKQDRGSLLGPLAASGNQTGSRGRVARVDQRERRSARAAGRSRKHQAPRIRAVVDRQRRQVRKGASGWRHVAPQHSPQRVVASVERRIGRGRG